MLIMLLLCAIYYITCNVMYDRRYLTFWHWSGVTPYTSSYEFAGSCVFGKQSPGRLSLRPLPLARLGQALFRRYGRFFAEFLGAHSLVRLTLLELITCVGLRYGSSVISLEIFLGRVLCIICYGEPEHFRSS